MRKTNALYSKKQRLIAETQRHTQRCTDTHTQRHIQGAVQRITLHFAIHMNLNKLLLQKYLNIVPT